MGAPSWATTGPRSIILVSLRDRTISARNIVRRLGNVGVEAVVDDHRQAWRSPRGQAAIVAVGLAVPIVTICLLFGLICRQWGRGVVLRNSDWVALMIRLGARHALVRGLLTNWIGVAAFVGALIAASGVFFLMISGWGALALPVVLRPEATDLLGLPLWPFILYLLATLGSRSGANSQLDRREAWG